MAGTLTSSMKASEPSGGEWVYLADLDEPAVLEAYTGGRDDEDTQLLDSLFTSTSAVEVSSDDGDSPTATTSATDKRVKSKVSEEYFGDDGIVDDRIPPETAFETFLGKNFPVQPSYDFSSSLYNARPETAGQSLPNAVSSSVLPGAESREERLARLTAEVNALAAETGASNQSPTDAIFEGLSELREQLCAIENTSINVPTIPSATLLNSKTRDDSNSDKKEEPSNDVSVKLVAPATETLSLLERRVSSLERAVGVADLEAEFDGVTLAALTKDVRTRLAFVTDEDLPAKLKEDARQIAHMLRNDMQSQRAKDALRVATILDKLHSFFPLLDTLPVLIDRLVSVRRLHTEAANFSQALSNLAVQLDRIEERRDANKDLLESVRSSMDLNIQTVNSNLAILKEHIENVRQPPTNTETTEATLDQSNPVP